MHIEASPQETRTRNGATHVPTLTLDSLLELPAAALGSLYASAPAPRLADVSGDLRGRMLAWSALPSPLATAVRALAGSDRFPWRGKSFAPRDADSGDGVNRLVSDRLRLFTFGTSIGPSRADGAPALQLDYDHPGNPFFIRRIQDEMRQLAPGLYLGQAYLVAGRPRLWLYFGLARPQ